MGSGGLRERGEESSHYTPRRQERLRWLNVAWVDCDIYNVGATWAAAVGVVQAMQDEGIIPPASFLVRSGRGLWLLWLLRGEGDSTLGERAYWHNVQLWAMVQHELASRLRLLGADTTAGDGARVARIPGSVNTKSGERVAYLLQGGPGGRGFSYTLPELASRLGLGPGSVEAPPPLLPKRRAAQPALPMPPGEQVHRHIEKPKTAKQRRAIKGWQARAERRLDNFAIVRDLRGGFKEGHRNHAARLYAGILWSAGYRSDTLRGLVAEFSQGHCKPPLSPSEVSSAAKRAGDRVCWAMKSVTISEWLEITPEEAQVLSGWYAKGEQPPAAPPGQRKQEADRRRALEVEVIRTYYGGRVPPLRALQAQLAERGVEAVVETIAGDLRALKIDNPRARRGRQLPLDLVHD